MLSLPYYTVNLPVFFAAIHASLYEQILSVRKAKMNGAFVSIFSCLSCVYPFREAFEELLLRSVFGFCFRVTAKEGLPYLSD